MKYASALITGASGGIGYEFARLLAADCEALVLVARNTEKLDTVKRELEKGFPARIITITRDLAASGAAEAIHRELAQRQILPDILINNAGFGDNGLFVDSDLEKDTAMLQVNVVALTQLTRLFAADMASRGRGMILNVASTAAFQPGPYMAVYYASKAYVLSFSEALAYELKGTGVTVTTLCPGPTATDFAKTASAERSRLFRIAKPASAAAVARTGYDAMKKGKMTVIHGLLNGITAFSVRTAPRKLMPMILGWLHQRGRRENYS
ncbi:MAG: SDR family oxidoreductase [Nitrospiraceae bacterium]|nr:SDR family oxidoreductase [Nitrospiraceae bacterium]